MHIKAQSACVTTATHPSSVNGLCVSLRPLPHYFSHLAVQVGLPRSSSSHKQGQPWSHTGWCQAAAAAADLWEVLQQEGEALLKSTCLDVVLHSKTQQ